MADADKETLHTITDLRGPINQAPKKYCTDLFSASTVCFT
jgi:hypothetical protein